MGLIPRRLLRLCHSREGGNPASDIFPEHPPEFIPAKAGAGVTVLTIAQILRYLLRGAPLFAIRPARSVFGDFCRGILMLTDVADPYVSQHAALAGGYSAVRF
jgi:hypothetical protein